MADIKVCDRCGKKLPDILKRFGFTIRREHSICIHDWMLQSDYDYQPDRYDLCEGCYRDFVQFIECQELKGKD